MPNDKFINMSPYGGMNLLIFAADQGHTDMIEYLLQAKININATSNVNHTIIDIKARRNSFDPSSSFQSLRGSVTSYKESRQPRVENKG